MKPNIEILASHEIDQLKWDACVSNAENGLIYSRYDYLTQMSDNWHGVVINDYSAVMALPCRKKLGIRYIYQPSFIQQLGIIGGDINAEDLFTSIHSFASYGDILFNYSNQGIIQQLNIETRVNLVIDLSAGYYINASHYKKDLLANLRKAEKEALSISIDNEIALAISMYKDHYQQRMKNLSDNDYTRFQSLCALLEKDGMCFTRKVQDEKGDLLAIGLFLRDEKRIYNLMNTTTDEGRSKEANHFLLDEVIKEFSESHLLFDFEGSDLPGVKSFYEKFGAVDQPYFYYHYNNLPRLLRLIKP
jgi:hypothetical protein